MAVGFSGGVEVKRYVPDIIPFQSIPFQPIPLHFNPCFTQCRSALSLNLKKCPKRLLNCSIKMSYIEIFDKVEKKVLSQSTKGVQGQPICNQRYPYNTQGVFGPSRFGSKRLGFS